ncbi:NAD(P)-dependent oxidoreductase [Planctomycetota bacterium]|nr:NAD(P)-dependent oxidoreductase [Planctomycetota bacterium]
MESNCELSCIGCVGFIGLGIMGKPMAENLIRAGHKMCVWNRTESKCESMVAIGADMLRSPGDVAAHGPDVIFICVTNTEDVKEILFSEKGIAKSAKQGLIVVDHSTIDAKEAAGFADCLAGHGVKYLDAPVSGGDVGAKAGTLSIMVGGDEGAYQTVRPMLEVMGKEINYMGESGMGQVTKSCNQVMVSCNLMGVCEAMMLAKKSGLDLDKMIRAVSGGAAGSWSLSNLGPKIKDSDWAPGFMVKDILKDLGFVSHLSQVSHAPLTGTSMVETLFQVLAAEGEGELGTQALAKVYEKLGGFEFTK